MGAEFSKRKRKGRRLNKETWTGENEEDQKAVVELQVADKENQCVLQWIQTITSDRELFGIYFANFDHQVSVMDY